MTAFAYRAFAHHTVALIFLLSISIGLTCADKIITAPPGRSWYIFPTAQSTRADDQQFEKPLLCPDQTSNTKIKIQAYRRFSTSWLYGTRVDERLSSFSLSARRFRSVPDDFQFAQAFRVNNPGPENVQIYFSGEREIIPIRQDQTVYDRLEFYSGHKTGMIHTVPATGDAVIDID